MPQQLARHKVHSKYRAGRLTWVALLLSTLSGCAGSWDDFTWRDFSFKSAFVRTDPLVVLRDEKSGDKRAKALAALKEPAVTGGTSKDQDAIVQILVTAASSERQPLCRLAAIETLGRFKDPRAVDGLTNAFYNAGSFASDAAAVIRCRALTALGETKNQNAVDFLVRVVREPQAEGSEIEKQQNLDVRIAAVRALGNFEHYQATSALVRVLATEKDVSLKNRAHASLQQATGKRLPPDAKAWEELVEASGKNQFSEPGKKINLATWVQGSKQ